MHTLEGVDLTAEYIAHRLNVEYEQAQVLAAAPAMKEALERVVSIAGCSHFAGQAPSCDYCKARAALTAAKGEDA